jgi:predicted nucleic acid-binding Zn ribbon protein
MATTNFTPGTHYARNRARILAEHKEKYWAARVRAHEHCVVCGEAFSTTRAHAKYCSPLCQSRGRSRSQKAAYWQTYYAAHRARLNANHRQWQAAKRRRPNPRPCRQCGRGFTPKRDRGAFCSRKCCHRAISVRNRRRESDRLKRKTAARRARILQRVCVWCGRLFKPARRERAQWCSQRCMAARWSKDHPDVKRAEKLRRRARLRGVVFENISPAEIYTRDGWTCQLCHRPAPRHLIGTRSPRRPTIDHIVPIAKGGAHTHQNVQCACSECNSRKSARIRGQFRLF